MGQNAWHLTHREFSPRAYDATRGVASRNPGAIRLITHDQGVLLISSDDSMGILPGDVTHVGVDAHPSSLIGRSSRAASWRKIFNQAPPVIIAPGSKRATEALNLLLSLGEASAFALRLVLSLALVFRVAFSHATTPGVRTLQELRLRRVKLAAQPAGDESLRLLFSRERTGPRYFQAQTAAAHTTCFYPSAAFFRSCLADRALSRLSFLYAAFFSASPIFFHSSGMYL